MISHASSAHRGKLINDQAEQSARLTAAEVYFAAKQNNDVAYLALPPTMWYASQ